MVIKNIYIQEGVSHEGVTEYVNHLFYLRDEIMFYLLHKQYIISKLFYCLGKYLFLFVLFCHCFWFDNLREFNVLVQLYSQVAIQSNSDIYK